MRSILTSVLPLLGLLASGGHSTDGQAQAGFQKRQGSPSTSLLTDFQVYPPVLTPEGTENEYGCVYTEKLMDFHFANSINGPFVGNYTPPPCSFNRVTINFTVTAKSRQYDRLVIMYLGDNEVWRSSTAEPTTDGIVWTYVKEMQQYNALWRTPQTLIFDIDNFINSVYVGIYNATLTATFFTVPDSPPTADSILPISKQLGNQGNVSMFQIPGDNASSTHTFPPNVARAVVSLSGCGQAGEEFWYSNTFNSNTLTFPDTIGELPGGGPWRELQVLIDGQLAGVAWPFPTIFTGGIVPGFWRPIVGIDAFDLREREVDITPWLPQLVDGRPHRFEIRVASIADDGYGHATVSDTPTSYWWVTGKIFVFLDHSGRRTTGSLPVVYDSGVSLQISSSVTRNSTGSNQTLTYSTSASRAFSVSGSVNGHRVEWVQRLDYSNLNELTNDGYTQYTQQSTTGLDTGTASYVASYSFPIASNSTIALTANGSVSSINGTIDRGLDLGIIGDSVFPSGVQPFNHSSATKLLQSLPNFAGSTLNTTQSAIAVYIATAAGTSDPNFSFGTTNQSLVFAGLSEQNGISTELYSRDVSAVNSSIVYDRQVLLGRTSDP